MNNSNNNNCFGEEANSNWDNRRQSRTLGATTNPSACADDHTVQLVQGPNHTTTPLALSLSLSLSFFRVPLRTSLRFLSYSGAPLLQHTHRLVVVSTVSVHLVRRRRKSACRDERPTDWQTASIEQGVQKGGLCDCGCTSAQD